MCLSPMIEPWTQFWLGCRVLRMDPFLRRSIIDQSTNNNSQHILCHVDVFEFRGDGCGDYLPNSTPSSVLIHRNWHVHYHSIFHHPHSSTSAASAAVVFPVHTPHLPLPSHSYNTDRYYVSSTTSMHNSHERHVRSWVVGRWCLQ